jgi:hypothetical protein
MTMNPSPRRYLIATDNGAHEFLLFDRKDALACGPWKEIEAARKHLETSNPKDDAAPAWTPKSGGY